MNITSSSLTFIIIGALFCAFLLITNKKIKARFADSPYVIVALGLGTLLFILFIIAAIEPEFASENIKYIRNYSHFLVGTIAFSIFLYFDLLLEMTPSFSRFSRYFAIWLINFIIIVLDLTGVFIPTYFHYISGIIGYGLTLFTSVFGIYVIHKTLLLVQHKGLKIDMLAMIAILISAILLECLSWLLLGGFISELNFVGVLIYYMANCFLGMGLFLLVTNIIINGDYVYFIPIEIHTLMIYNKAGLLLFNYKNRNSVIHKQNGNQTIDHLISGAFMALSSIFKELLGQKSQISYVNAQNYEIFLTNLPKEVGTLAIITSGANSILKRSIHNFITDISPQLLDGVMNSCELGYFVQQFSPLLKKHFPYLVLNPSNYNEILVK